MYNTINIQRNSKHDTTRTTFNNLSLHSIIENSRYKHTIPPPTD